MKKKYTILLLLVMCALSLDIHAQSVSIPQATLDASPMGTVENNGGTIGGFTFAESSGAAVPSSAIGLPNVTISVSLQYVELKNFDVNLITGDLLNYFTPTYNSTTNILLFEQNAVIPGDWFGSVEFPISVTQNSTAAESFNGFNANIAAVDVNTNAQGNATSFTYTDVNVLSIDDVEVLTFQALPNPTKGIINIKLQDNSDTTVQIVDVLGKVVFKKEYTRLRNISLNLKFLESAVYFLKVTSSTGATNTLKIAKE